VYSKEFKAEAVAPAEKREKPIGRIAAWSVLRRWMQQAREAAGGGLPAFPGHGRPRDESDLQSAPARLRKENKALKEAV
jgi:transposase-like protein